MERVIKAVVEKSTAKETEPGQFITKLVSKTKVNDPLMGEKAVKRTYYLKGSKQLAVGQPVEVDLNNYNVTEHEGIIPDGDQKGQKIMMKWLHLK